MSSIGTKLVRERLAFHYDMGDSKSFVGAPTINYMNVWYPRKDSSYATYVANTSGSWQNNHPDAITVYSYQTGGSITGFVNSGVPDWSNTDHCVWSNDIEVGEPVLIMRNYDGGVWKAFSGDHSLNLAALGLSTGDYYTYSMDLWTTHLNHRPNPGLYSQNAASQTAFHDGLGGSVADMQPLVVGEWHRRWCSFQISADHDLNKAYARFYWYGYNYQNNEVMKIRRPQLELGTNVASPWTLNPRTDTDALIDLTGNHTVNIANCAFSNNNIFYFTGGTGANGAIISVPTDLQPSTNAIGRTWEIVAYPTTTQTNGGMFGHVYSLGCSYFCNGGLTIWSSNYQLVWYDNTSYQFLNSGVAATSNTYAHIVGTYNPTDFKFRIYINGVLKATSSASNLSYQSSQLLCLMGFLCASGNPYTGQIPIARWYYNKCLTDAEVAHNFSGLRARFGL